MEAVIILGVIVIFILIVVTKKSEETTSPSATGTPPVPLSQPSKAESTADNAIGRCSDLVMLERELNKSADLAQTDPTHYRNATGAVVVVCNRELNQLNIIAAVARPSLTWKDVTVAAKARAFIDVGLRRGEEHCAFVGHELTEGFRNQIMSLYSTAALVSRIDGDSETALRRNMRRVEHASDPDEVSETLIEAMLSDASRAGGAERAAETLTFFSELCDERPGWDDVLTPRIRRVVNSSD